MKQLQNFKVERDNMDYQKQQPSGFIFKIFLWVWTVFKVFIEFVTILLCYNFLAPNKS